ncbi:MAG: DUF3048 domain-containing protein [Xylanivirga thermophila]|jgi:hypothetical protein|uniref:DUF3048 domain-containing protein n=1 Tax=Xylanivirga thermophila TaxID=2496273 RepID=UPI00101BDD27|nr:DUF3048 domain-containing protein [Xylanivirga thermophila]
MKYMKLGVILSLSIMLAACSRPYVEADKDMMDIDNTDTIEDSISQDDGDKVVETVDIKGGNICPLTGIPYEGTYKPVAIMIENSPKARPQSGLSKADIVYEVHAEGGITRFMALFLSNMPNKVGPIRSVRHYYMQLAQEWDAYLVHYGQSFIAEEQFDKINVKRLNGLNTNKPFWRDKSRKAPHNVYIDALKCQDKIDFDQTARGFSFSDDYPDGGLAYEKIVLPFNDSYSKVEYIYDDEKGQNMRYNGGRASIDQETGKQLSNKNIIVQYAEHSILEPGAGYRDVKVFGKGRAAYFIDGRYYEGTWSRKNAEKPTVYYNEENIPITLKPGNTWIEIVPDDMEVSIQLK